MCILAAVSIPAIAGAIGVSVSPATLSLRAAAGKEVAARFTVRNPSREVGLFEAYPEEFEESFTLIPSRFVLEAEEKREVLIRARRREVGALRTAIAVEAQPLGAPAAGIGGGVRVPVSLEVLPRSSQLSSVFSSSSAVPLTVGVVLVCLLAYLWRRNIFIWTQRMVKLS